MADRLMPGMGKPKPPVGDGPSRAAKKFAKTSAAKPKKGAKGTKKVSPFSGGTAISKQMFPSPGAKYVTRRGTTTSAKKK